MHCSETGGLPAWKNYSLLQPVSNHSQHVNSWIPLGFCGKLLSSPPYQHDATSGLCRFLGICPSLGSKEGCSLYSSGGGFKSPCSPTASPPIPLPIEGGGAVNAYGGGNVNV